MDICGLRVNLPTHGQGCHASNAAVPFLSDDFRGESKVAFQNVPACVRGKTFFSLKGSTAESGMWEITYYPPTKVYVA